MGSALSSRYGTRPVVMAGGSLASLGLMLASFSTSLTHLYLSIGLVTGLGWALVFTPSMAAVAHYFEKRRTLATGLAVSGAGVSSLAFSPIFQHLVDLYGWRGALFLLAGISLNLVVAGALLRPLALEGDQSTAGKSTKSHGLGMLASLFALELLHHGAFMRYVLVFVLVDTGYFVPYAHLVAHAREVGCDEYEAAFVMSAAAIADVFGRVFAGWLADSRVFSRLIHSLTLWTILTGFSLTLLPLGRSFSSLMPLGICYGLFAGALVPLQFTSLVEIVGIEYLLGAIGLMHMLEMTMSSRILSKPPDGGWGWMVVLAAFVQSALVFGVIRSFGVFLVEFMAYFEEPSGTTSWITSVTVATLMFGSPLASGLGKKFGERPLAIIGGFLSGFGFLLASFATSLAQLYVFIGLLTAVANALVFSGSGIASLVFSPFFQFLVESYGWRGALLIVAGMVFNLVVCGALLRPLNLATDDTKGMFIITGYFIPFAHLVPHAREQGFDEYQAAFLVSAVGISDIVGRIISGGLAGWSSLRLVHNYTMWAVLTSVSLLVVPLGHSYVAMVAISICYGFVASAVIPLKFSSLVEIVGMDQIMGAIGLIHMMESVGALAGPPLSGWIHDVTGSYNASFLTSGAFIAAGSLGLLLLPGFFACHPTSSPKHPKHPEGHKLEGSPDLNHHKGMC
ncbi:hypothetical protein JD844_000848 [Phrynosoma platyrhinos]|uniref:Major facilitator superfamily (MFS) profile domain-containing protein n=1 Tax=Phrynosoma platyrhinos TaxID=52577 RepID=A0ABQ7T900_PHRPL|nr:hypothetical protein JD844_000848 [Phrynosoma platyrhinos]